MIAVDDDRVAAAGDAVEALFFYPGSLGFVMFSNSGAFYLRLSVLGSG